jgi:hypothetical protein
MRPYVLGPDSVIAAGLALLIISTRIARRLLLPRQVYVMGAVAGFLGWGAFLVTGCSESYSRSLLTTIWILWIMLLPLPLLAGLSGWLGARPPWRWVFLCAGVAAGLMPLVAVVIAWRSR